MRAATKAFAALLCIAALPAIIVAPPQPRSPDRLVAAMAVLVASYPAHLSGYEDGQLFWKSGPATPIGRLSGARTAAVTVAEPEIADLFAWSYPLGTRAATLGDPGRARPASFFTRIYGDCRRGAVEPQLVTVRWAGGRIVRFNKAAGAAAALERVARDLDALGPAYAKYLWPIAGTYNCRTVAGTNTLSLHAYGAAIDLNSAWGRYWRWNPRPSAKDSIPPAIITAFERHGFIWGGKWAHFDSFHFEYRPELILLAKQGRTAD